MSSRTYDDRPPSGGGSYAVVVRAWVRTVLGGRGTDDLQSRTDCAEALRNGAPQRALAVAAQGLVARASLPDSAALAGDDVQPVLAGPQVPARSLGRYFSDLLAPPSEFSSAIWSSDALVRGEPSRGRSVLRVPAWLETGPGRDDLDVRAGGPANGPASFVAVCCDFSDPVWPWMTPSCSLPWSARTRSPSRTTAASGSGAAMLDSLHSGAVLPPDRK